MPWWENFDPPPRNSGLRDVAQTIVKCLLEEKKYFFREYPPRWSQVPDKQVQQEFTMECAYHLLAILVKIAEEDPIAQMPHDMFLMEDKEPLMNWLRWIFPTANNSHQKMSEDEGSDTKAWKMYARHSMSAMLGYLRHSDHAGPWNETKWKLPEDLGDYIPSDARDPQGRMFNLLYGLAIDCKRVVVFTVGYCARGQAENIHRPSQTWSSPKGYHKLMTWLRNVLREAHLRAANMRGRESFMGKVRWTLGKMFNKFGPSSWEWEYEFRGETIHDEPQPTEIEDWNVTSTPRMSRDGTNRDRRVHDRSLSPCRGGNKRKIVNTDSEESDSEEGGLVSHHKRKVRIEETSRSRSPVINKAKISITVEANTLSMEQI